MLTLTVIARVASLQKLENAILVNLTTADLMSSLLGYGYLILWNSGKYGDTTCMCLLAATSYQVPVTIMSLSVMTIDKYVKIFYPFQYLRYSTKCNITLTICTIHIVCICGSIGTMFSYKKDSNTLCIAFRKFDKFLLLAISVFLIILTFLLALMNLKILYMSWKKRNGVQAIEQHQQNPQRQSIRGVKVLAVLLMFLFVLYIPGCIQFVIASMYDIPAYMDDRFVVVSITTWQLAHTCDGIAFLLCRRDIRSAARKMLKCDT